MDGILVVDKPKGISSFEVVRQIRRRFKIDKVGHCGTLDPLATGILVLLLGKSTKLFSSFSSFGKEYEVTLRLGISTNTGDSEGEIISQDLGASRITFSDLERVFINFKGETLQTPSMFSALKHKGKCLYELARLGIEVPRQERKITIDQLNILKFYPPYVDFYVACSKGTYVRSLVEDAGKLLGCGAHVTEIRRVGLGPFKIKDALKIENLDESCIRPWPV